MNKMLLFIFIVIIGVFGILVFSNQNNSSQSTMQLTIPSLSPTIEQISVSPTMSGQTLSASTSSAATSDSAETNSNKAIIKTSKGNIELLLYPKDAPKTVANFIQKAKSGFYNNLTFHRVEDWVIQGGDPKGNGTGGGNMPVEFNDKPFVVGSLGVASRGDGKVQNDSQFFITKKEAGGLNGQYTNFGIVTSGMDVVNKMEIGDKILGIIVE